jgi:predicted nucleotidyltransferase
MSAEIEEILRQCHSTLVQAYGDRLKGIVLFGSVARNQAGPGSDIDLLVLLEPPLDYFIELRRIIDLLYPVQLESEQLISAKPADADEYAAGAIQLYRNARRVGVLV